MNLIPGTQYFAANGDLAVGTSGKPIRIFSIELISGATASTLKVYNSTAATNNQYAQVDGVASQSVVIGYAGGKRFPAGAFVDMDANGSATVVYTEEF